MIDADLESPAKKQKSRAHTKSVIKPGVSGTKMPKDRVASPVILKEKINHPRPKTDDVHTPVKRHKSKDSVTSAQASQIDSNPDQFSRVKSLGKQKSLAKA